LCYREPSVNSQMFLNLMMSWLGTDDWCSCCLPKVTVNLRQEEPRLGGEQQTIYFRAENVQHEARNWRSSSFNGIVATVFGVSGFVGKYVANKLGKFGTQVIVPYRGDHYDVLRLRLVGDLGQVLHFPYHLQDEVSIRTAMKHSNVVINLVGRDWETRNFNYKQVNVDGARLIARMAKECGVKRLIHFSSLNCEDPQALGVGILPEGSQFLKKTRGRARPYHWRRFFQWLPLWYRGERTVKQPVYVRDVAQGVINAIYDPDTAGQTFDVIGPKRYQLGELVDWFFRTMRRDEEWGYRRTDLRWSPMFQLRISMTQKYCPSWPVAYLNWDKIERDHVTDSPTGNPTLEDLGVTLTDMEGRLNWELKPYRAAAYYDEELGEFAIPDPPKPVSREMEEGIKLAKLN
ncbi:NADH dehydrogenase [ubiquinone] 1 alpha subcomplex subunit 9, mitochondrial, partial [Orchesella cincta]